MIKNPSTKAAGNRGKGRRKGSKNKKTLDLYAIMKARDFDPAIALMDIVEDVLLFKTVVSGGRGKADQVLMLPATMELKVQAYKELMKYTYPARKAVEISTPPGEGFQIEVITVAAE